MPLPGAGLSGGCLPLEAAGGTAPVAGQLWKPGFSSGRNSVCRAWRLWGGAADLLSSGQERPCCPGPSRPLPVPGDAGSWAVSRRPVLRILRWWIRAPGPRSPLRGAAAQAPPSCSWNRAAPSARISSSARAPPSCSRGRAAPSAEPPPEPLRAAPGPAVRAAALRELGALSWARSCCYCPREPEGTPALLGPAPTPHEPLSAREGRCSSCSSGTGLSCPGDTRPGLSPAPRGAPPPWRPLFLYFSFPVFLP